MLGASSIILSLLIACESEPDTTEVDQALEQFEPKGPTFQDRVDEVKRKIGTGEELQAIGEIDLILDRRASEESFWRMLYYSLWSSSDPLAVQEAIANSSNISQNESHLLMLQIEGAKLLGNWDQLIELAQKLPDADRVAWTARAILSGHPAEGLVGELPEINDNPRRRKKEPDPLPEVTPDVAFYRLMHLEEFPEGHQAHYEGIVEQLNSPELTLLKAELALSRGQKEAAVKHYEEVAAMEDILLKQKAMAGLVGLLDGAEKRTQSQAAFELALEEGNSVHGNIAFMSMVDSLLLTGAASELPDYIKTNFDEKVFLFKDVKPSWVHHTIASGALRGGALSEALSFARKIRTGSETKAHQVVGADLEALIALEAGQGQYLLDNFVNVAAADSTDPDAPEAEQEEPREPQEAEANPEQEAKEAPTDEENAQEGDAPDSENVAEPENNDDDTNEITVVQQLVLDAYRGANQVLEPEVFKEIEPGLQLPLLLSLSRHGLVNAKELLEQFPEPYSSIDKMSIAIALLEIDANSGDSDARDARFASLRDTHLEEFPNLKNELDVRNLINGTPTEITNELEVGIVWKAISGAGTGTATCELSICGPLNSVVDLNTQSTEEIIVRTQNIWENLPLHRKGVLSVGTALDGSDGFPTAAAINDLTSKSSDVEMGLIISYQEIDRRRDNFRQDASFGLNPLYDLDDEKALTYFKNIVQVRMQMMGYYSGGVFPSASFDALKEQEKILFETEDFSRIKPMGRVDIFGLKERLERISLLSYSVLGDDLIGVVVSPNGTSVEVLGSVSEIEELVSKHHKAQIASLDTKGFDHSHGHKLRQIIYDPFEVHLQGYGRYMAIGPEFLYQNSYMTLPEQQDGLLFLARNRTVTYLPSLYEINKSASEFGSFESDIVGFARPLKADVDIVADPLMSRTGQPAIVELSRVHFRPDSRMLFTDDKVTQQRYVKNSFSSRFLFVSGLESSKNGGWIFDDQELTISEIQSRKMVVQTVFLSFDPDFESQMRRVRAYMNAGARTVVMSVWRIPQAELRVYLDGIFEALTRDEPLTAALKQGRKQVLKQRLRDEGDSLKPNPSIWGSFIVFGQP